MCGILQIYRLHLRVLIAKMDLEKVDRNSDQRNRVRFL